MRSKRDAFTFGIIPFDNERVGDVALSTLRSPQSFLQTLSSTQANSTSNFSVGSPPSLIWLFKQRFDSLFLMVRENKKVVALYTCNIVVFYGIKESFGDVVTYIVVGLLLSLSNTEQFFEPVLYYEIGS